MSRSSVQLNLPPSPVNRLDGPRPTGETAVQKLDSLQIPLEMAKAQIGKAFAKTIARSASVLKDFGDPSQVKRFCDGDVSTVLAKAWQKPETRRELVKALAEESDMFDVRTHINERIA
jgi:hypothetical protein